MGQSDTVEQRIIQIVAQQLGKTLDEVTPEKRIVDDLDADSLDTVELTMAFEDEFKIEIPDEDAEKLVTVQAVINYIKKKTKQD